LKNYQIEFRSRQFSGVEVLNKESESDWGRTKSRKDSGVKPAMLQFPLRKSIYIP